MYVEYRANRYRRDIFRLFMLSYLLQARLISFKLASAVIYDIYELTKAMWIMYVYLLHHFGDIIDERIWHSGDIICIYTVNQKHTYYEQMP